MTQAPAMIDDKILKVACAAFSKVYGAGLSQVDGRWKDNTEAAIRAALTTALAEREPVADRETCKLYHSRWPTEDLLKARGPYGLITDDGEAWKYQYTHSDGQAGVYDLVYRPRSALVATPPAERVVEAHPYTQDPNRASKCFVCGKWHDDPIHNAALATKPAVKDDETVVEALRDFVAWVDTWVSNPVGAYSVDALNGLFGMARDRIAALAAKDGRS